MSNEFTMLGLLGPAGSGKDLTADWFVEKGFVKVAFADPMKRFVQRAFGFNDFALWGSSEERNRLVSVSEAWWFDVIGAFGTASRELVQDVLDEGLRTTGYMKLHDWLTQLRKDYREQISARVILQTLGTEWGREVDPTMWVKYAHKVAAEVHNGYGYSQFNGLGDKLPRPHVGVVIPDHRFANEVEATKQAGGYVLRLKRLSQSGEETVGVAGHKSEAEMKTLPDEAFNLVLEFPEGIEKVHEILEKAYEEQSWSRS